MADRQVGRSSESEEQDGGRGTEPRSVDEAREQLHATRQRLSRNLDAIEARLRGTAEDIRERLDVLEPARERIRAEVWTSLALAFGAGLAYALMTGRRRDGRRGPVGHLLHTTATRLPGAVFAGVRAGVADRVREDWRGRRALPGTRRSREETVASGT